MAWLANYCNSLPVYISVDLPVMILEAFFEVKNSGAGRGPPWPKVVAATQIF